MNISERRVRITGPNDLPEDELDKILEALDDYEPDFVELTKEALIEGGVDVDKLTIEELS